MKISEESPKHNIDKSLLITQKLIDEIEDPHEMVPLVYVKLLTQLLLPVYNEELERLETGFSESSLKPWADLMEKDFEDFMSSFNNFCSSLGLSLGTLSHFKKEKWYLIASISEIGNLSYQFSHEELSIMGLIFFLSNKTDRGLFSKTDLRELARKLRPNKPLQTDSPVSLKRLEELVEIFKSKGLLWQFPGNKFKYTLSPKTKNIFRKKTREDICNYISYLLLEFDQDSNIISKDELNSHEKGDEE